MLPRAASRRIPATYAVSKQLEEAVGIDFPVAEGRPIRSAQTNTAEFSDTARFDFGIVRV
jgi:hypothetical protein